jgi:hypothetical protein
MLVAHEQTHSESSCHLPKMFDAHGLNNFITVYTIILPEDERSTTFRNTVSLLRTRNLNIFMIMCQLANNMSEILNLMLLLFEKRVTIRKQFLAVDFNPDLCLVM